MCKQSRKVKAFLCVYAWTCFFPWGWMPPHSAYLPVLLFQDYVMAEKYNSPNRKVKGQAECCCTQKKHISDDVIASRYMDIAMQETGYIIHENFLILLTIQW